MQAVYLSALTTGSFRGMVVSRLVEEAEVPSERVPALDCGWKGEPEFNLYTNFTISVFRKS